MINKSSKSGRNTNFNERGKFIEGNVIGRMPKNGFTLTDLNKLVKEFEKSPQNKRGSLLKHYIKRLYKNDRLLAKYLDKNIPTKNELTGPDGGPVSVVLNELVYKKPLKKEEENTAKPETLDK